MEFVLFTDNLSDLSIDDCCREVLAAGFDGLDITMRPGGHVPPEEAEMKLSAARMAADKAGATIPMASTAVTSADSPHAEDVFAAAAHYGVRKLKLGYWGYQPFGSIQRQLNDVRWQLASVVRLGKKYHVLPCVHIHSGNTLSNHGSVTYLILKDFAPDEVGAYVDPMHMTAEGGVEGWRIGLDLLAPWVALVGVKNSRFRETERDSHGQMHYRSEYVPLADGHAPLPDFFACLKQLNYDGIISLHSEYKGGGSWRKLSTPELLKQSADDLKYLKSVM